jgi:hypothetical protein
MFIEAPRGGKGVAGEDIGLCGDSNLRELSWGRFRADVGV